MGTFFTSRVRRGLLLLAMLVVPGLARADLPPLPAELRRAAESPPDEKPYDVRMHFLESNERRHDLFFPLLLGRGRGYVGVGADQNYTLAAKAGATFMWLVDIDGQVVEWHKIYAALIPAAPTPADLCALFDGNHAWRVADALDARWGKEESPALYRTFVRDRLRLSPYLRRQLTASLPSVGRAVPASPPPAGRGVPAAAGAAPGGAMGAGAAKAGPMGAGMAGSGAAPGGAMGAGMAGAGAAPGGAAIAGAAPGGAAIAGAAKAGPMGAGAAKAGPMGVGMAGAGGAGAGAIGSGGQPVTWLSDPALYAHVRDLMIAQRVVMRVGDLHGEHTMLGIAEAARTAQITIRTLYLSNAEQWFRYSPQFRRNVAALPRDSLSVVLRTLARGELPAPPGDRWHFSVQSLDNFVRRLQDPVAPLALVQGLIDDMLREARDPAVAHGLSLLGGALPVSQLRPPGISFNQARRTTDNQ